MSEGVVLKQRHGETELNGAGGLGEELESVWDVAVGNIGFSGLDGHAPVNGEASGQGDDNLSDVTAIGYIVDSNEDVLKMEVEGVKEDGACSRSS